MYVRSALPKAVLVTNQLYNKNAGKIFLLLLLGLGPIYEFISNGGSLF